MIHPGLTAVLPKSSAGADLLQRQRAEDLDSHRGVHRPQQQRLFAGHVRRPAATGCGAGSSARGACSSARGACEGRGAQRRRQGRSGSIDSWCCLGDQNHWDWRSPWSTCGSGKAFGGSSSTRLTRLKHGRRRTMFVHCGNVYRE